MHVTGLLLAALAAVDGGVAPERLEEGLPSPFPLEGAQVRLNVGFQTEWGVFPESLLGATVSLRIGGGTWSGLLEAWTVFPAAVEVSTNGSIDAYALGGMGGVCGQWILSTIDMSACALGRGGALLIDPRNTTVDRPGWQPTAAVGGRFGVEWPRDSVLGLFVSAQLFVPVLRPYFRSDERSWFQPMVYGGGRIGFLLRFR